MEIQEFIEKFAETIEVENVKELSSETNFKELDEWSSLSVMLMIAFYDEEFGKELTQTQIREAETIQDLYQLATA